MTEADRSAGSACDRLEAILGRSQALEPPARADDALRAPRLAYARAILRMRIRPALEPDWPDADPPHAPKGCPFQAWSVGELLRLEHVVLAEGGAESAAGAQRQAARQPSRPVPA